nr:polysaccharide deacetylase family protein [Clostridium baratii]
MRRNRKGRVVIILSLVALMMAYVVFSSVFRGKDLQTSIDKNEKSLPIHSVDTQNKEVALSFDVNWAEKEYLYDILNILDKYNIKATFFVMGKWLSFSDENAEKLKKIKEGGHEIGNHSYLHPNFSRISNEKIEEEVKKTDELIEGIIGEKTKLFRFPSGDYNERAAKKIYELGYMPIQWDADSVDWKEDGESVEYERVKKKIKNGSITLFHNNAKHTPKNLERLIKELQSEGYEFKKIGDMIYKEDFNIDSSGIQHKNL